MCVTDIKKPTTAKDRVTIFDDQRNRGVLNLVETSDVELLQISDLSSVKGRVDSTTRKRWSVEIFDQT